MVWTHGPQIRLISNEDPGRLKLGDICAAVSASSAFFIYESLEIQLLSFTCNHFFQALQILLSILQVGLYIITLSPFVPGL